MENTYLEKFKNIPTTQLNIMGDTLNVVDNKDVEIVKNIVSEIGKDDSITDKSIIDWGDEYSCEIYLKDKVVYFTKHDLSIINKGCVYSLSIENT